ncbi:MAG: hypothetical protein D3911_06245 [Candidatus Electrothrix sp. AW3_4]|nr:hypothetical protein [Candidatus Electrothrix gigas]
MNRKIITAIIIATLSNGITDALAEFKIDTFANIQQKHQSECFSSGRTWYSFGELNIKCNRGAIKATGQLNTWAGFGVDPGPQGTTGAPINIGNNNILVLSFNGNASGAKLEVYNSKYKKSELWIDLQNTNQGTYTLNLPDSIISDGSIAKMQFVFSPGSLDFELTSILLDQR